MPIDPKIVIEKFQQGNAHVAVIGLGYVGLPLAVLLAQSGYRVTGIDVDTQKVDSINRGESYIEDIPSQVLKPLVREPSTNQKSTGFPLPSTQPGLPSLPGDNIQATGTFQTTIPAQKGSLWATNDFAVLADCDAVSICVPTPLNKTGDPDISYIVGTSKAIARYLHPGMVIVLESTTYPGTTTEVVLPILTGQDSCELGGPDDKRMTDTTAALSPGRDFFLAYSPERVDPGRTDWTTQNTPKVIGGVTPACLQVASAFYARAIETLVPVSSPETAEMVKLFENTFRMVNIGLANELLMMCDKLGLDAWEVLDAAATKPFGFMKFTPGPGLGGHCIPIDPHYLSWKMRTVEYKARFIELASEINTQMPHYWVQKVQDALNERGKAVKGSRVLVLGVSYKKDVGDLRESPALDIIHLLREKGAEVEYHDPYVPSLTHDGLDMVCVSNLDRTVDQMDCIVIATDHSIYEENSLLEKTVVIVDTRHMIGIRL